MIETPQYPVDVPEVRRHYDRLSPLYRMLWGEHIHHGYWTGEADAETPAQAQIQLMEQLARRARFRAARRCSISAAALEDRRSGWRRISIAV